MSAPPRKKLRSSGRDWSNACKSDLCSNHSGSGVNIHKKTSNAYCKADLNWLVTNGLFPARGSYICDECLEYAAKNRARENRNAPETDEDDIPAPSNCAPSPPDHEEESDPASSQPNDDDVLDGDEKKTTKHAKSTQTDVHDSRSQVADVIKLLRDGKINGEDLSDLCLELGKSLSTTVFNDSKTVVSNYRDVSLSSCMELDEYLQERPPPIINLLSGLSMSEKIKNIMPKKKYPFCLLLEQLYAVRNNNFVGPCSFSQGLLKWTIHGSSTSHKIDGATTASGSTRTLKRRFWKSLLLKRICASILAT